MLMILKCHIRNTFTNYLYNSVTLISRHTIKTPLLSAYIYYLGLEAILS